MKKVIVASKNPVKIQAARDGFTRMFPDEAFEMKGISVASGVSDQPETDEDTLQGALNRAENACEAVPDADFWVGLEGGIEHHGEEMATFAWITVRSRDGRVGKGRTGMFFLPPKVAELVRSGMELGAADDVVFGTTNSKQAMGATGLLTHGAIDRTGFYSAAIILALIPLKNKKLYS